MKIKMLTVIAVSVVIILVLFYFLLFSNNKNEQNIMSILKLSITEEKILKKEIRAQPDYTTLILYVDYDIKFEKFSLFDIASYEGSKLYDDLENLTNENDMKIDEVEIRLYYIQHSIKDGLFSEVVFGKPVYIVTENNKNTIIYTNIPEGIVLPREYRPQ